MTQALIKYEAACRAIAECVSVDEVKTWADKAAAMQAYQRMAGDRQLELDAAEIRLRAERQMGKLILAQKAEGGLNKGAAVKGVGKAGANALASNEGVTKAPKLADVGISYDQSSRAQKLAAVPDAEFEAELAAKREREQKDTARVTARLEQSGSRHLANRPKTHAEQEREQAADDAFGDADPVAMLEDMHKQVEELTALVVVAEADDLKAEAIKWRRISEAAQRAQSDYMDRLQREKKEHEKTYRWLARCGKAVGETDPDKIASAVEAFARQHRQVPA